jgi:hypothetical protein
MAERDRSTGSNGARKMSAKWIVIGVLILTAIMIVVDWLTRRKK